MRKFKATKVTKHGTRVELWAAAFSREEAIIVITALMRRGFNVENRPDLPDPPTTLTIKEHVLAEPGWKHPICH